MTKEQRKQVFKMTEENINIDAGKASTIVKKYIADTYGNLGNFTFRLNSISRNTDQNVWIVKCEVYATAKDTKPTQYTIKVNVKTSEIVNIESGKE
ncbi:MAG: hypothetical protein V1911_00860 [Candidatus Micrarchaeota archaeon]